MDKGDTLTMTYRRTGRYNEDVPALEAEIAKLRAALTTARLYVSDQMIAGAIVVPAGEEPDAATHPSLLQVIDAALVNGQ